MLNPRHRSAHEHLGELYLVLGEPAEAEQQLATLEEICLIPCVEDRRPQARDRGLQEAGDALRLISA